MFLSKTRPKFLFSLLGFRISLRCFFVPTNSETVRQSQIEILFSSNVQFFFSRGITYRERHLMDDVRTLLPHSKKDVKLDKKDRLSAINEIADIKNCNRFNFFFFFFFKKFFQKGSFFFVDPTHMVLYSVLYFEERKHKDLYLWMARSPNGPSIKFHVTNIHTMDELKMTFLSLFFSFIFS